MNIYVSTKAHRVGLVICNNENSIYYYGSFKTESNTDGRIVMACQRAVHYLKANNVESDNVLNVYTNTLVDFPKTPEYLRRYNFEFVSCTPQTDKEKQRMLLAKVETEMAERRAMIGIKER